MSSQKNTNKQKKIEVSQNNSKLYYDDSIEYNMDDCNSTFYKCMKKGYLEMAEINLQLALETELLDIDNKTWLSGE